MDLQRTIYVYKSYSLQHEHIYNANTSTNTLTY